MVVRSLQARIFIHLIGVPCIDFSSLVMALCNVDDDFSRGLWPDSSSTDSKGKNTSGEQRADVNIISSINKGPSSMTNQLCILPGHILLAIDISTNNWFHLSLLIGHTRTLFYHKHAMQFNSQGDLLPHFLEPNLHRLVLLLLWIYHDAYLN